MAQMYASICIVGSLTPAQAMAKYTKVPNRSAESPHIYFVSDAMYHNLFKTGQNQCAVISGESGAGKTESAKFIIKHIIELSPGQDDLEKQIIQVSLVTLAPIITLAARSAHCLRPLVTPRPS